VKRVECSPDEAIPHPTNLALFGHKITLYRFNQGAHTIAGGLKSEQGTEPPHPLTLTTASYQIQDDGRPPFWKYKIRNNSVAGHPISRRIYVEISANFNFCQKNRYFKNQIWRTAAILKVGNSISSAALRPISTT